MGEIMNRGLKTTYESNIFDIFYVLDHIDVFLFSIQIFYKKISSLGLWGIFFIYSHSHHMSLVCSSYE